MNDTSARSDAEFLALLEQARHAEREQAITYRRLAGTAEEIQDSELAQRFHDLHADEQHHFSRLTARLLELRVRPVDALATGDSGISLANWKDQVRAREAEEVNRYRQLLRLSLDPTTRHLLEEILAVEEHHLAELGGKWTPA